MENNNIEFNRWNGVCKHINNFNLAYDIPDIKIDINDEWDVEYASIMIYVGENLRNDIILQLDLSKDEREGLENDGWLDCFAHFNVETEEVEMINVDAYLGANDYKYLYIHISNPQDRKELYKLLYTDEGFVQFVEEIKEYNAEMENEVRRYKEKILESFIEALDIFQKAFESLADYASGPYIKEEWFNGYDNYPFEWSFDEMPGVVKAWIEGVKSNVKKAEEPVEKFETNYSREANRTFIMKCTYKGDDCIREECVGFYAGEPSEGNTKYFCNGNLVAEYERS